MIQRNSKITFFLCLLFLLPFTAFATDEPAANEGLSGGNSVAIETVAVEEVAVVIPAALPTVPVWAVNLSGGEAMSLTEKGAAESQLGWGTLCLDCDTQADCNTLCGARGFSFGACLRDLGQVCSPYPDNKICSCF